MKVFLNNNIKYDNPKKAIAVLGMLDGLHLGHKALLETAAEIAEKMDLCVFVYSFLNNPLSVIRPGSEPEPLMTFREKAVGISALGGDYLALVPFDREFSMMSPRGFIEMLMQKIPVVHIAVGYNYTFGLNGAGNPDTLRELSKEMGFALTVLDAVCYDGKPISSSRIRGAISEGDMELANAMLGRHYSVSGRVVEGRRLGKALGFPTANIEYDRKLLPQNGVYISRIEFLGESYPAVSNIGVKPTLDNRGEIGIETHILDFDGNLYGMNVKLSFIRRLRSEIKYKTLDELAAQVKKDAISAKEYFMASGE